MLLLIKLRKLHFLTHQHIYSSLVMKKVKIEIGFIHPFTHVQNVCTC